MSLVALLPFIWMILGSFKTGAEIRQIPPTFFPQTFTLDNYRKVLTDPQLPLGLFYSQLSNNCSRKCYPGALYKLLAGLHLRQI